MKSYRKKYGITLVETLITVAIIAILVTITISIATSIDNKSDETLTAGTLAILDSAIEEFRDYGYNYYGIFSGFDFPLDCNGLDESPLETLLAAELNTGVDVIANIYNADDSGIEVLYFFLSRVPASRKLLDKIDQSLFVYEGSINVGGQIYPLVKIVDPWKRSLRYTCYLNSAPRNFPEIRSAGADGIFDNEDDIVNR